MYVGCDTEKKAQRVLKFMDKDGFDFLRTPRNAPFEILIEGDRLSNFIKLLEENDISFKTASPGKVIRKRAVIQEKIVDSGRKSAAYPRYAEVTSNFIVITMKNNSFYYN